MLAPLLPDIPSYGAVEAQRHRNLGKQLRRSSLTFVLDFYHSLCLQRQAHKLRVAPFLGAEYLDLTDVSKLPKVTQKTIYSWGSGNPFSNSRLMVGCCSRELRSMRYCSIDAFRGGMMRCYFIGICLGLICSLILLCSFMLNYYSY